MGRYRIGLAGMRRGLNFGRLFAADERCEVTACCDVSHEVLAVAQRELALPDNRCFEQYDDLIACGCDVVFVGTPIPCHARQTIAALEAGSHVLCEVTAADTVEDCARIVDTVRRTGRTYMMAENCIFWPFVGDWERIIRQGRIGEIFYAECEYVHPIPELMVGRNAGERMWRADRPPLHYCSHSLGPVLHLTGDRIVRAMGVGQGHRIMPEARSGGIDIQVALFETERGAIIKLLRSSVAPRDAASHHHYFLQGTRGYICTDRHPPHGNGLLYVAGEMKEARVIPCPRVDTSLPEAARQGGHGTAEYSLVKHFLDALDSGRKPLVDENRAIELTVPGLVAHRSATQGGAWLEVPGAAELI